MGAKVSGVRRLIVWLLWNLNVWGTILSVKLVKLTGKSPYEIHPKHLVENQSHRWYLQYLDPQDTVLDVGCGNAMHTLACAAKCRKVYGFDHDLKQLQIGREKAWREGVNNIHLSEGNAEKQWAFPDGYFDKVLLLDILEHLNRCDLALREARRVLRNEGRLILSVPNRETSWKRLRKSVGLFAYADEDHKVEYTQREIEQELAHNGWACERVELVVYDTPWAGAIDLIGGMSLAWYRRLQGWKRGMALKRPKERTGFRIVARVQE